MNLTEAQASLMDLLAKRMTPQRITLTLDWSSARLYAVMKELTVLGVLREAGELPSGAESRVWPPAKWIDGCALALPELGWDADEVRRMQRDQSRAGQFPPESGGRHIRSDWTGQAIRRVEWGDWVVQGLILPRLDRRYAMQAAPKFRAMSINDVPLLDEGSWWTRGRIVPIDAIRLATIRREPVGFTLDEQVALTMAVAWVMESRALLDVEALEAISQ